MTSILINPKTFTMGINTRALIYKALYARTHVVVQHLNAKARNKEMNGGKEDELAKTGRERLEKELAEIQDILPLFED